MWPTTVSLVSCGRLAPSVSPLHVAVLAFLSNIESIPVKGTAQISSLIGLTEASRSSAAT